MASNRAPGEKTPLGGDLIVPALAFGFAVYFFISIADLNWEAKANGVLIGGVLVALVALQVGRVALAVTRGRGDLGFERLFQPFDLLGKRLALVGLCAAFIALLPVLGLALALFLVTLFMLLALGVRRAAPLVLVPLTLAAAAYLMFIVVLNTEFPHGPVEKFLGALR